MDPKPSNQILCLDTVKLLRRAADIRREPPAKPFPTLDISSPQQKKKERKEQVKEIMSKIFEEAKEFVENLVPNSIKRDILVGEELAKLSHNVNLDLNDPVKNPEIQWTAQLRYVLIQT